MRRSLGGSYYGGGGGSGGGGGGGGEMLRTVGKGMRARLNNFQENVAYSDDYSPSSPTKACSSSTTTVTKNTTSKNAALSVSSQNYNNNLAFLANSYPPAYDYGNVIDDDDYEKRDIIIESEWECLENYYDPIFGVVPSTNEVQHAITSLQQVLHPQSIQRSSNEELITCDIDKDAVDKRIDNTTETSSPRASSKLSNYDWLEPSMQPYDWKMAKSSGWDRVYDAIHLLESEPSVQRMVVSLSSDKAVWDAVLNNEAVREIRDSYRNAVELLPSNSHEKLGHSKSNINIIKWIFDNMKQKLLEVLGNISQFLADIYKPLDHDEEKQRYSLTEKLKSSFLLTVVVLLLVVMARGHKT